MKLNQANYKLFLLELSTDKIVPISAETISLLISSLIGN